MSCRRRLGGFRPYLSITSTRNTVCRERLASVLSVLRRILHRTGDNEQMGWKSARRLCRL